MKVLLVKSSVLKLHMRASDLKKKTEFSLKLNSKMLQSKLPLSLGCTVIHLPVHCGAVFSPTVHTTQLEF